MDNSGTTVSKSSCLDQRRTKTSSESGLSRGNSLGSQNRSQVAGYSRSFPLGQHMLASNAGMARDRSLGRHLAEAAFRVRREGASQMGRSFCGWDVFPRKKRDESVGKTKRGKGTKLMVVADGKGIPIGLKLTSATPHESTLIEDTLDTIRVPRQGRGRPRKRFPRLIYDRAADSLPLRKRLKKERKIDLICPQRSNQKIKIQDRRKLRRYRRRWKSRGRTLGFRIFVAFWFVSTIKLRCIWVLLPSRASLLLLDGYETTSNVFTNIKII